MTAALQRSAVGITASALSGAASRMLCADGAGAGGASLEGAIYDYNHAAWYVSEVLDLAAEYAKEYP